MLCLMSPGSVVPDDPPIRRIKRLADEALKTLSLVPRRSMVEAPFEHSAFSRNRERLLAHDVAGEFFRAIVEQRARRGF